MIGLNPGRGNILIFLYSFPHFLHIFCQYIISSISTHSDMDILTDFFLYNYYLDQLDLLLKVSHLNLMKCDIYLKKGGIQMLLSYYRYFHNTVLMRHNL